MKLRPSLSRRAAHALLAGLVLLGLSLLVPAPSVRAQQQQYAVLNTPAYDTLDAILMPVPPRRSPSAPRAGWTDSSCGSCHQVDPLFSHPVGLAPSRPIPGHLPLHQGLITCTTCHDDRAEAHAAARAEHGPLLRATVGAASFCTQCHDPADASRAAQHGSSLARAHARAPVTAGTSSADVTDDTAVNDDDRNIDPRRQQFDPQTQQCLSCHDGLLSSDVAVTSAGMDRLLKEHPVGVLYPQAGRQRPDVNDAMHPQESLDPRVGLIDGRVGCTSCHSVFSTQEKLLVMSNRRSDLCLSCHRNPN